MSEKEKYFVIGIGGTGMRCIEAFTHLCAIGMFDNKEIDVLSVDTDTNNGNKGRTEQLLDLYRRIKTGSPTADTFFSAKLNLYRFAPEYSGNRSNYELISGLNTGTEDVQRENKALSDLFFGKDVQQFNLDHGYRAQTHLGSHLMYHAILEAARRVKAGTARNEDRELAAFLDKIFLAGEFARVFILGSIFGGTGASSIPVIPKALHEAIRIKDKTASLHPGARFGCSLLTEYFSFNSPDSAQLKAQRIIADSGNFSRNSQAALMFYQADSTVRSTYQQMYHIGWPGRVNFSEGEAKTVTITGGGEQKNPSHITELLCACAAGDFFENSGTVNENTIVFKSVNLQNNSFLFEFDDFFGPERSKEFMNKLGAFFAFAHLVINYEKGGFGENGTENLAKKFSKFNVSDYVNLPSKDTEAIDAYLKSFAFNYDTNGNVIPGWLFQVRQTVEGAFLFHTDAFSKNQKQLQAFHFGKLFTDEAHQFARKGKFGLFGEGDPYEEFCQLILKDPGVKPSAERQRVENLNERFLAHIYNTLTKLYSILKH